MKFVVCGDSWFTSLPEYPGASFGEIIAAENNWELISLARGGCSNFAIALQIDKALEMGAEFILIGSTSADRIEIPIIDDSNKGLWEKLKYAFNLSSWAWPQPKVFTRARGLSNIQYSPHPDLSCRHEFLVNPTLMSETLSNLSAADYIERFNYLLTQGQKEAIKSYILNLYDSGTKNQVDSWIISNACRKLVDSKVPFLIFTSPVCGAEFYDDLAWMNPIHNITNNDFDLYSVERGTARFHYNEIGQGQKIANYIQQRINTL